MFLKHWTCVWHLGAGVFGDIISCLDLCTYILIPEHGVVWKQRSIGCNYNSWLHEWKDDGVLLKEVISDAGRESDVKSNHGL
jgi:hypothetical protein